MGRVVLFPLCETSASAEIELRRTAAAAAVCRLGEGRLSVVEALLSGLVELDGDQAIEALRRAILVEVTGLSQSFAPLTDAVVRSQS